MLDELDPHKQGLLVCELNKDERGMVMLQIRTQTAFGGVLKAQLLGE